jgi:hypothetical protein
MTAELPERSIPVRKQAGTALPMFPLITSLKPVSPSVLSDPESSAKIFWGGQSMKQGYATGTARLNSPHDYRRGPRGGLRFPAIIVAFTTAFAAAPAGADELSLLINGKAIHINVPAGKHLNEKNWGMGFQYDWKPVNVKWIPFASASGFSDSNSNPSYYAGGGVLRRYQYNNINFDVGVIGFAMTRKNYKNDNPFLGVLPAFSVGTQRFALNMTYIPKVDPKMVALLFFQIKINLDNFR